MNSGSIGRGIDNARALQHVIFPALPQIITKMETPRTEKIVSTSSKGLDQMTLPATPPSFTASNFLLPPIMKNPATKEEAKVFMDFDTGCSTVDGSSREDDFWVLVYPRGGKAIGGLIAPRRSLRSTHFFSPDNSRHSCDADSTCESLSELSPVASPAVAHGDAKEPSVLHLSSSSSPRTTILCAPCFAPIQSQDDYSTRIRDT